MVLEKVPPAGPHPTPPTQGCIMSWGAPLRPECVWVSRGACRGLLEHREAAGLCTFACAAHRCAPHANHALWRRLRAARFRFREASSPMVVEKIPPLGAQRQRSRCFSHTWGGGRARTQPYASWLQSFMSTRRGGEREREREREREIFCPHASCFCSET
jgi:hypothetical protein